MNKRVKSSRIDPMRISPASIRSMDISDATVRVLGICDVIDALVPGYYSNRIWTKMLYSEMNEILMKWAEKWEVSYYTAPREEFFISKGVELALHEGNSFVIVEDLS